MAGFSRATHLLCAGFCDDAVEAFQTLYADAAACADEALMAACLCELAWCSYKLGRPEEALEYAIGARRLWDSLGNSEEVARSLAVQAIVFLDLGFSDEAFELAERAVALVESGSDSALLAFALNIKGVVLAVCHEIDLGIGLITQAASLATQQGNLAAQGYYLLNLGFCHARMAEEADRLGKADFVRTARDIAIALYERAIESARATGDLWTQRAALCNAGELHSLLGNASQAGRCLADWIALPGEPGSSMRIQYLYTASLVLLRSGKLEAARDAAVKAVAMAERSQQIDHQVNALARLAEIEEALGDAAAALATFKRFHACYVQQSGETAQRRVRIEEIRSETRQLRIQAATLADQALRDPLTGIANRRSFDQVLNQLAGSDIVIAIVDLDHFKTINDRYSHIVGDAVLQRVARVIAAQMGESGHAARLGGEEFALVFAGLSLADALAICEGICQAIASVNWSDLAPGLAVTASIGLAGGDGTVPSGEIMQIADNRLYIAKTNGRNCVVAADALVLVPSATPDERRRWRA